jgi:hypothetical protein
MNYIFFSDNKWFLHPGDFPVKPSMDFEYISQFNYALMTYDNAIADIKAKALEIANPEILQAMSHPEQKAFTLMYDGQEYVKEGEFCEWPGTFEKKETLYANDKYEVKYKTEVAHLVLPTEEKNDRTKEMMQKLVAIIEEYTTMDIIKIKHDYPYYEDEHKYVRSITQQAKKLIDSL